MERPHRPILIKDDLRYRAAWPTSSGAHAIRHARRARLENEVQRVCVPLPYYEVKRPSSARERALQLIASSALQQSRQRRAPGSWPPQWARPTTLAPSRKCGSSAASSARDASRRRCRVHVSRSMTTRKASVSDAVTDRFHAVIERAVSVFSLAQRQAVCAVHAFAACTSARSRQRRGLLRWRGAIGDESSCCEGIWRAIRDWRTRATDGRSLLVSAGALEMGTVVGLLRLFCRSQWRGEHVGRLVFVASRQCLCSSRSGSTSASTSSTSCGRLAHRRSYLRRGRPAFLLSTVWVSP